MADVSKIKLGSTTYNIKDTSKLPLSGGTITGTLILSKTQDASGTANNSPALIVGGAATSSHLEFDSDEIMAKSNGTTASNLYLNHNGGIVYINAVPAAKVNGTITSGQVMIADGTSGGIKTSGYTIATSVPSGAKFTDTNTWRGVVNGLTSDATDQSLSAAQGKALANGSARDSTKLPLSGGTLTGGITFNKVGSAINYTGSQATYSMIKFKDNTADTYGNGIIIGGGGLVVIGGGESSDTVAAQHSSGGDEILDLCSDGVVNVYTNVQSGWDSRKSFTFGSDGTFNSPSTIKQNGTAVSLNGHTHNYAGSSSAGGVAISAAKLSTARNIALTGSVTGNANFDGSGNISIATTTNHTHNNIICLGRRTSAATIKLNPCVDTGCVLTYHISDGSSRSNDATNSPSFDAAIINLPWDWGAHNGQIALANTTTTPRMQIRAAASVDNGESANPRYTPNYSAWREVVTATKATTIGGTTQPVYISNTGQATAISYTIAKSVPSDAKFTDTNTWRGIQNNLTSDSTSDSLSAAQGKALANGSARDSTKLPLSGGTLTGALTVSSGDVTLSNGLLNITKNSNTVTIGSQNSGWVHIQNSTDKSFYFNRDVHVDGDIYKYNGAKVSYEGHTHNYIPLSNSRYRTLRDFTSGTLITTDLDGGTTTSSVPFLLKVQGNGYGDGYVEFYAQGYVYNLGNGYSNYIQIYGYSVGKKAPSKVYAFKNSNGKLAFWFERLGYWHGYDVYVGNMSESTSSFNLPNHVVSITNTALPSSRTYSTEITIQQVYATDNTSKNTIGSASGWSAGSTPTLGTAIAADDITAWSAGSTPTLGTAIAADDITAWTTNTPTAVTKKTVVTGKGTLTKIGTTAVANGILDLSNVLTDFTLTTGDSVSVTAGTKASLSYTARSIPNVTSVGSVPSLSYTARSIPNVTSVGSVPSLTVTNVTNVLKAT